MIRDSPQVGPATVGGLLALPEFSDTIVLAGRSGMGRPVAWVTRLDELEDALAIDNGDLLLVEEGETLSRGGPRFLTRLAARGIAGIAMRRSAGHREAPEESIREAEDASLPLVLLPPAIGYRELSLSIASLSFGTSPSFAAQDGKDPLNDRKPMSAIELLAAMFHGDHDELERVCLGSSLRGERDWPDIRAAVEAYLVNGGNAIAAASELGVHRHTIRARLKRYEMISGLFLDDSDSRLAVGLAFRLASEGVFPVREDNNA